MKSHKYEIGDKVEVVTNDNRLFQGTVTVVDGRRRHNGTTLYSLKGDTLNYYIDDDLILAENGLVVLNKVYKKLQV